MRYNEAAALLLLGQIAVVAPCTVAAQQRAAAAVLTIDEARARKARIDDVVYDLRLDLAGSAERFSGSVTIGFDLSDADEDLRLDFTDGRIAAVTVNGETVEAAYNGYYLTLPADRLRRGANRVAIDFSHAYSMDGNGLHRFRDPVDGRSYLYTDFEPYDQNRLFPSFDQPNLKGRFTTEVTVPASWQVISNRSEASVVRAGDRAVWSFAQSPPISTYVYALHAGEYRAWESAAGEIPLRLFARQSLADYVDSDDWFVVTRQGLEFYERYFDVPYPFGKYDQIIVPEFNAGAMENVAAVTFSERFLSRGTVTRNDRSRLAYVILHEMAHMWFGDLVTMDWWNGLWLNESFATFMAYLALAEGTEFTDAWERAYRGTVQAYAADERDTTHAIELPVPDTDAAFANFDTITYQKGSATLTQLNHLVGGENFRRGVSRYLKRHAYGNTTTADFLDAVAEAANTPLEDWSDDWLLEPGTNTVAVDYTCRDDRITSLAIRQTAPRAWPTLRTHRTQLGLYSYEDGRYVVDALPLTYAGAVTDVPAALGYRCPDIVYANHGDWDYARVRLNADILPLLEGRMQAFSDPLTRSMLWQSVWDNVLDARLPLTEFVDFALRNLAPRETTDDIVRQVLSAVLQSARLLTLMDEGGQRFAAVREHIEAELWNRLRTAEPGSDRQALLFDNYVESVTSAAGFERLSAMLASGTNLPSGLELDQDRRWFLLEALAAAGMRGTDGLLTEEIDRDNSDLGQRSAYAVRASLPEADNKRAMLERLFADPELSVADARAIAAGLFPARQTALLLEFAPSILERLPDLATTRPQEMFGAVIAGLVRTACREDYLEQLDAAIAAAGTLHPELERGLIDTRFEVARCLAMAARQREAG